MSAPAPDPLKAARMIGRLLDAVERGELDASATTVAALIGARLALEALAEGREPAPPDVRNGDPSEKETDD